MRREKYGSTEDANELKKIETCYGEHTYGTTAKQRLKGIRQQEKIKIQ